MVVRGVLFVVGVLLSCSAGAFAQGLKVDINNTARQYTEGTDPAFVPWSTEYAWFGGGDSTSAEFDGITVTFTRVGSSGTSLRPSYWKAGVVDLEAKLVGDGIKVDNGDAGPAQIEMRISGLSSGLHSLLTYHNDWDNHDPADVAPLNIHVDGIQMVTNLPLTVRVIDSTDAATAYLEVEAVEGQDVVVLFAVNAGTAATKENVWINGFEIDATDVSLKAIKPSPAHGDEHVDADGGSLWLSWTAGGSAVLHDVYLGTDSNAVRAATRASPEFQGTQAATNFLAETISSLAIYHWRVDEVDALGVVTPGDLWRFRARHLAFPGAEGYGRFARGGRGGVVVKVTNLNDSGPGSFRDAVEGDHGPRTIVFDVGGLITLESDLILTGDRCYITVAGQTAPGKGICTRKYQFGMSGARDVICRFIRSRPGDISGTTLNGSGMAGVDHVIMDHCSISWGIDEEMSTRNARNLTLQRTLISEALHVAGHDKYPPGSSHGYAASVGGDIASLHHNLLAHCEGRNWSLAGGLDGAGLFAGRLDIFNNVVYNWAGRTTDGGAHQVNFVNNYYKPGPAMAEDKILTAQYENFPGTQQYYFAGNVMLGYYETSQQTAARAYTGTPQGYSPWVDEPFFPSHAVVDEVTNAYLKVLSDVGCNLPMMDDHDARVIEETIGGDYTYTGSRTGRPGLPDSQEDAGGWEDYGSFVRPADWDTDDDGLPDWWERIKGLNPNSPPGDFSDSNGDPDGDEYTNLEDYLHWMAEPHVDCAAGSYVDIDLATLTRGFADHQPAYQVLEQTHGIAAITDDHRTVRFTPTAHGDALGGFRFMVSDGLGRGYNMTRTVNVRIIGAPRATLGMRREGGALHLELTADPGTTNTVQTATDLGVWMDWTNIVGTGSMQLLPLDASTTPSPRYFRTRTD